VSDAVLKRFLDAQFAEGKALAAQSDILELQPVEGMPPRRFVAVFHAKGLAQTATDEIQVVTDCLVGIWFPDDYLIDVHPARVLTYLGPHPRPWHPNLRVPHICAHIRPGTPLVQLLHTVYEIWTWQLYSTSDEGLNHAASQWARHQDLRRFPVDRRPLKRRTGAFKVQVHSGGSFMCNEEATT
jgi:hypothetical protein